MKRFLALFRDIKFNVWVFSALAVSSVVGTLLPQNPEGPEKVREFIQHSPRWGAFLEKAGFFNIYYSWWYVGLLGLLAFDVIVCKLIFDKFPGKSSFSSEEKNPKILLEQSYLKSWEESGNMSQVSQRLEDVLRLKKYKVYEIKNDAHGSLFAVKGSLQRFGSWISHVSILLILSSNLVGSLYGFRENLTIPVTGSLKMEHRPWVVACDQFSVDWYPGTSTPRKFASDLRIFSSGQLVKQARAIVNGPLEYKKVRFYQASYGPTLKEARIGFFLRKDPKKSPTVTLHLDQETPVPGTPYSLQILQFVPDFSFDGKKEVTTLSAQPNNPALQILVLRDGKPYKAPWIFEKYPTMQMPPVQKEDEFILLLAQYVPAYYTGLQIAYDPGADLFWLACSILVFGLMILFYLNHRKVWIFLEENPNGGVRVNLGAASSRGKSYEAEFEKLTEALRIA